MHGYEPAASSHQFYYPNAMVCAVSLNITMKTATKLENIISWYMSHEKIDTAHKLLTSMYAELIAL